MADRENSLPSEIGELYRTSPDLRPVLDFYIFFKKNAEAEWKAVALPSFQNDRAQKRLAQSQPAFALGESPVDIEAARRFIQRLSQADFPVMENLLELIGVFQNHPDDLAQACRLVMTQDREGLTAWSEERDVVPDLASVVVKWALQPSLMRLRDAMADPLNEVDWRENTCPLCGAKPYMARLEMEGARTLACGLCGHEWRFSRLQCPFCGTEDHSDLAYLSDENDPGYRIDVCRKCNHYLKTVDSRERGEALPMEVEDILTQHLDMVARERGYSSP